MSRAALPRPPAPATAAAGLAALLLAACASAPPPPDWRVDTVAHLDRFNQSYLKGQDRIARREFDLARDTTARTGRPDLIARLELGRCAAHVASLDFAPCTGFDAWHADATSADHAYARYLQGQARPEDIALLPPPHRAAASGQPLAGIADPLSRLLAAAVRLRSAERADPGSPANLTADSLQATVDEAVATASAQGWRRPLLAWLAAQRRLALDRGDADAAQHIQRRIDLATPAASTDAARAPTPGHSQTTPDPAPGPKP